MEAKELMIGDILHFTGTKYYHPCNVKVLSLYNREGGYPPASFDLYDFENNCVLANISKRCIEPIPLTAEMLEKNGWKKHATYGTEEDDIEVIYMLYQHSFEVTFYNNEAVSIRHFVPRGDEGYDKLLIEMRDNGNKPMYVHTLQHALCLMGLSDLADNFEVD